MRKIDMTNNEGEQCKLRLSEWTGNAKVESHVTKWSSKVKKFDSCIAFAFLSIYAPPSNLNLHP